VRQLDQRSDKAVPLSHKLATPYVPYDKHRGRVVATHVHLEILLS